MRFSSPKLFRVKVVLPIVGVTLLAVLLTAAIWWSDVSENHRRLPERTTYLSRDYFGSSVADSAVSMFSLAYPADRKFEDEIVQLRVQGKLKPEDEILIQRAVLAAGHRLKMPPSLLWCLFFQESRLNHLLGIEGERGAHGLGQFIYFSFYEINHHLDRYGSENYDMLVSLLGKDVRPIEPKKNNPGQASSYYAIPTAVVSSAAYLNNRYLQLKNILEQQQIPYEPQILWLYAAMAYNKGTRAVLSFWNEERARGGKPRIVQLVTEKDAAMKALRDVVNIKKSLAHIWPEAEATQYAKELSIHMENIKQCATTLDDVKAGG
jgi:hypothetical protein